MRTSDPSTLNAVPRNAPYGAVSSYPPIHDYALIGDCRTAALVSRSGSIDWLCLPRFDSASCFNRLLDWKQGGYCALSPTEPYTVRRSYRDDSAVLVTDFLTESGTVRVTDAMPVVSEEDRQRRMWPFRQVLRRIEGMEGRVELDVTVNRARAMGKSLSGLRPAARWAIAPISAAAPCWWRRICRSPFMRET